MWDFPGQGYQFAGGPEMPLKRLPLFRLIDSSFTAQEALPVAFCGVRRDLVDVRGGPSCLYSTPSWVEPWFFL